MKENFKPNALLFLPYLAPYRVDMLNGIGEFYNLTVVFTYRNAPEQKFNQRELRNLLKVKFVFLDSGFDLFGRSFRFGVFSLFKSVRPAFVFVNEYNLVSVFISILKKLKYFNFTLIATTSDNVNIAHKSKLIRRITRKFVLSNAKGIVVYGEKVASWYRERFPNLIVTVCSNIENPLRLLSNKENVDEISKNIHEKQNINGKKVLIFVGRFAEVKNIDLLIESFNELSWIKSEARLFLIGDGPLKPRIINQLVELKLDHIVTIIDRLDSTDLYAWYNIADCLILPSKYESFGAVVNEALIWGCPCIVSDVAGATEYICDGVNGNIFKSESKQSLIENLDKIKFYSNSKKNLMLKSFDEYINAYNFLIH